MKNTSHVQINLFIYAVFSSICFGLHICTHMYVSLGNKLFRELSFAGTLCLVWLKLFELSDRPLFLNTL